MRTWTVRITQTAQADFQSILVWTAQQFGTTQAQAYAGTLSRAMEALTAGPNIIGAKPRDDIAAGLHTLHVARGGQKGRHFILFRVAMDKDPQRIDILRLLHDAMDLARHVQEE